MRLGQPREGTFAQTEREAGIGAAVLAGVVGFVVRVVWWLLRHPRTTLALVVAVLVGKVAREVGDWVGWLALSLVAGVMFAWRVAGADHFARHVTHRARAWWRSRWVFARRWQPAMLTCGLTFCHKGMEYLPALRQAVWTPHGDVLRVGMLPGQTVADYAAAADQLAQSFGMTECRVRSVPGRPQLVELWFVTADPLAEPVGVLQPGELPDLAAVPVALGEDGSAWGMPLLGSHVLVGGATGSGKGSVLWSMIAGLATAVRDRTVSLWVIDPKGGVELAAGAPMFDRFAYDDAPEPDSDSGGKKRGDPSGWGTHVCTLLEDAVAVMQRRLAAMRGHTRMHAPSRDEPMIVIVIDELLALTALVSDRGTKNAINAALMLLLSQGRAAAVCVVAATQDARKELVGLRDFFPTRIALRTTEKQQADLILGDRAHERGARTEQIPVSLPGVGYVQLDGQPEPLRVRFTHVTDDDIDRVVLPAALDRRAPVPPLGADGYPVGTYQWRETASDPLPDAA